MAALRYLIEACDDEEFQRASIIQLSISREEFTYTEEDLQD